MKNRDVYWRRYKIQETLYIEIMPQSPSKQAPWHLTQFSQSPSTAPSYFPESHLGSEISSLSKVILVLGKARSCREPNMGCRGLNHLGDLMFHKKSKNKQKNCLRCEAWVGALSWWICQWPVACSCSLLNHLNSFHRGMFKLNSKFDADSLLYSLSHLECDGHTAHMLTQWHLWPPLISTMGPSLFVHTHSSPLSLAAMLHWCCTNHSHYINRG